MSSIGNVSVKISASSEQFAADMNRAGGSVEDFSNKSSKHSESFRKEMKSNAKDVKSFTKEMKLMDKIGVGGIFGGFLGGGLGGIVGMGLDKVFGITDALNQKATEFWDIMTGKAKAKELEDILTKVKNQIGGLVAVQHAGVMNAMKENDPRAARVQEIKESIWNDDAKKAEAADVAAARQKIKDIEGTLARGGGFAGGSNLTQRVRSQKERELIQAQQELKNIEGREAGARAEAARQEQQEHERAIRNNLRGIRTAIGNPEDWGLDEFTQGMKREREKFIEAMQPTDEELKDFDRHQGQQVQRHDFDQSLIENGRAVDKWTQEVNEVIAAEKGLRNAQEVYTDNLKELGHLKKIGMSDENIKRGAVKAAELLIKETATTTPVGASLFGTQEALSDINKAFAESEKNTKIEDLISDAIKSLFDINEAIRELNGAVPIVLVD